MAFNLCMVSRYFVLDFFASKTLNQVVVIKWVDIEHFDVNDTVLMFIRALKMYFLSPCLKLT